MGAYFRDNWTVTEHEKLRSSLERVVEADPGYSLAWACLCQIYLDEHRLNFNPRPDPLDRALEAARRAVASDPTRQEAHQALAEVHYFRHEIDAFVAEAKRAIALNPNSARTLAVMGTHLHYVGDNRGINLVRKAMKLDPFHPTWFNIPIAISYFEKSDYENALAAAREINTPGYFWTQIFLAGIYAELGRQGEARSALEELLRLYPSFTAETLIEELRKYNFFDDHIQHWVAALRKAGLPE